MRAYPAEVSRLRPKATAGYVHLGSVRERARLRDGRTQGDAEDDCSLVARACRRAIMPVAFGGMDTRMAIMICPHCQGEDGIQIDIRLKGDEGVEFFSCRRCETKWWERNGDTIALDEVLDLTARQEAR